MSERDFRLKVIAEWRVQCIERRIADQADNQPTYEGAHRARQL